MSLAGQSPRKGNVDARIEPSVVLILKGPARASCETSMLMEGVGSSEQRTRKAPEFGGVLTSGCQPGENRKGDALQQVGSL